MEELLKIDFLSVVNGLRRNNASAWTAEAVVRTEDIDDHTFDVDDPKDDQKSVKRAFGEGAASYVNGTVENPYTLRVVCYDEYLHQFVFDDGLGHKDVSMLKDNTKMADLIVYDRADSRVWIVVHELSKGSIANKRNRARLQLSSTLNMLCKSEKVKAFIGGFSNKWCITSARDERRLVATPDGMADAFMEAYTVFPEPLEFNFGVIKRFGFRAFETSKVVLGR
jgi:hypothetical protein